MDVYLIMLQLLYYSNMYNQHSQFQVLKYNILYNS